MTRSVRSVLVGLAALAALSTAGNAFAKEYQPSLLLMPATHALGGSVGVGIGLQHGRCCRPFATGRITIYSPPGYGVRLDHPAGTRLGTLIGLLQVGADELHTIGSITAESPSNHVDSLCAPGLHDAVWMLEFRSRHTFRIPMYVDRVTSGAEAAYASARMVACLPSPYGPPPQGAPAGIALSDTALGVGGVFTNPTTAGLHPWNAVFVPYGPGTSTLRPDLAAQSTSYVRLPVTFSITVKPLRRGSKIFVLTACVHENGRPLAGIRVQILGRARARTTKFTLTVRGRTDAGGCLRRRIQVKSKVILGDALAEVTSRSATACAHALAPRCSKPTIAPAHSIRKFRVRR